MGKQEKVANLLVVDRISKKGEDHFALRDISFVQKKHRKIAIAGETGSGKSTLLKIIAGLVQPDSGRVIFQNDQVQGPDETLVAGHPQIAYLSQDFELAKFLRVEQVLEYANKLPQHETETLLRLCQVDHLVKRKTDRLSGGEKQRIALCRLLIGYPKLLLLDEPFSHLDLAHKNILKSVIHNISEKLDITCILVSHDPQDTLSWADKILVMKDGKVVQFGSSSKIYSHPANEYVAGLFGKYNLIDASLLKKRVSRFKKIGKKVFIRPEQINIVSRPQSLLRGRVATVDFFGSYSEIHVSINGARVLVRTSQTPKAPGEIIHLSF